MFLKTTRVRRGNRTYEYLSLVEAFRSEDGKKRHNTLFRLGKPARCARAVSLIGSSLR